jgi:outer membrane protein with beta-barrel domain
VGAALAVELSLEDHWRLVSGLGYSRKGFLYYNKGSLPLQIDFLEIPLQIKWTPWPKAPVTPYLVAGGYSGIRLTDANTDIFITVFSTGPSAIYYERKDRWARAELGLTLGGGLAFRLGRAELLAQAEYGKGLTDLYAEPDWADRGHFLRVSLGVILNAAQARH